MFSLPSVHTRPFYLNSRCCTRQDLTIFRFSLTDQTFHSHAVRGYEIFLRRATFRNTEYTFRAPNTLLLWREEGEPLVSFTVPDGTYTPDTLATAVQIGMQDTGTQNYSVTYDDATRKFTITKLSGSKEFEIARNDETNRSPLADALGITFGQGFQSELTSDSQSNLSGPETVDLLVDVPLYSYNSSRFTHKLAEIPLVTASNADSLLVNFQNDIYLPMYVNGFLPTELAFALVDNDGVFYELPSNTDLRLEVWITAVYKDPYRTPF